MSDLIQIYRQVSQTSACPILSISYLLEKLQCLHCYIANALEILQYYTKQLNVFENIFYHQDDSMARKTLAYQIDWPVVHDTMTPIWRLCVVMNSSGLVHHGYPPHYWIFPKYHLTLHEPVLIISYWIIHFKPIYLTHRSWRQRLISTTPLWYLRFLCEILMYLT